MLHGVEYEDSFRNVIIFMSSEPVREDGVRGTGVFLRKLNYFNASALKSFFKFVEFNLSL